MESFSALFPVATLAENFPLKKLDFEQFLAFCLKQALARPYLKGMVDDYRRVQALSAGPVEVHTGVVPTAQTGVLVRNASSAV